MTPERMAELVARWVRLYTRNLPPPVAERRIGEIEADLHDHIAHDRAHGTSHRRIALSIAARMVRGMAADASWRGRMAPQTSTRKGVMKRVAIVTTVILLVLLVAMQLTDEMNWGVFDFVLAGVLLAGTGLLLELVLKRPRNLAYRAAAIAVAVAAIVLGEADDAPGLVLFGCLIIAGTVALAVRTALRTE